jgi:hypothetical protein
LNRTGQSFTGTWRKNYLGLPVNISVFVDANHAGNIVTRRSHTGILIYIQNTPILWHSRWQNTIKPYQFGSEFVALRNARDMIDGLRYKLRMFGIPLAGAAHVFCDSNQGMVKSTSIPESALIRNISQWIIMQSVRQLLHGLCKWQKKMDKQILQIYSPNVCQLPEARSYYNLFSTISNKNTDEACIPLPLPSWHTWRGFVGFPWNLFLNTCMWATRV